MSVRGTFLGSYPPYTWGLGAGVKADFLEEEEGGDGAEPQTVTLGMVDSPKSPSPGAHSQGGVAGLASAPRPSRWAPVLGASLGRKGRPLGPPSAG